MKPLFYGGYCPQCKVYHALDSSLAIPVANQLLETIEKNGCIDFEVSLEHRQEHFLTSRLFQDYGKMFGVLVAEDQKGKTQILKAFSYGYDRKWDCPGWSPPLYDADEYLAIEQRGNQLIYPLTEKIERENLNTLKRNALVKNRREISHDLMQQYLDLYQYTDESGCKSNIRALYYPKNNLPMGTGDCCAPKLLNEAHQRGWKAISLAEFYYGNPGKDGKRQSGQFYSSCQIKCHPTLGSMLCRSQYRKDLSQDEVLAFYPSMPLI